MSDIVAVTANRVRRAAARLSGCVVRTPLHRSGAFSEELGCQVHFKLENQQTTGSFKLRGAMNRLLTLSATQRSCGCVVASSGNHGAAVAAAMQELNVAGVIFVPENTSSVKVKAIRHYGGEVRFFGTDGLDTEQHARDYATRNEMIYISPYNDEEVIAGQGSCGIEIIEQLKDIDAVFVAVGGGGLIGGVGSVLKMHNPDIRVFGCQPAASAVMAHSVAAGEILALPSDTTLSDGTAGGIEADAITFELNRAVVDEFVLVDEDEIAAAMRSFVEREEQTIEGAAGVAIAGLRARKAAVSGMQVTVIVCGGNIEAGKLAKILRQS
jgi:threonine dehydratase